MKKQNKYTIEGVVLTPQPDGNYKPVSKPFTNLKAAAEYYGIGQLNLYSHIRRNGLYKKGLITITRSEYTYFNVKPTK